MKKTIPLAMLFFMFTFSLLSGFPVHAQPSGQIEIVFDSSRSMNEPMENQTKLEIAKKSIVTVADQITPGALVGLRVFGTTPVKDNVRESCFDSTMLMPIASFDKPSLIMKVMQLQAYGQTPLGYSLELAGKDFNPSPDVKKTIILISDGEESCGKNPVAVVKNLQAQGIDLKVHAIGLAVDERTKAQLQEISQITGGTYQDAKNASELKQSLQEVGEKENLIKTIDAGAAKPAEQKIAEPEEPANQEMLLKAGHADGQNLLAAAEGTRVETASNEDLAQMIDGADYDLGFSEGDFAVFSFKDKQALLLEKFAVPITEQSEQNPALFVLAGSLEGPDRGFFPIANFELKNRLDFKQTDQILAIEPPVAVKYLKVMIGPAVTGGGPLISEWKIFGKYLTEAELQEQLKKQTEKEMNLLAKDSGGKIIASSVDEFALLIDGQGILFGEEASLEPGQEGVFAFRDDKTAYITKMGVAIPETRESNCKTFEVSASNESASAGFGPAQSFQTQNMVFAGHVIQEFKLNPPLEAKYLKVRIVDSFGQDYCYLPELQAIGTYSKPAGFDAAAAAAAPEEVPAEEEQTDEPQDEEPAMEDSGETGAGDF